MSFFIAKVHIRAADVAAAFALFRKMEDEGLTPDLPVQLDADDSFLYLSMHFSTSKRVT